MKRTRVIIIKTGSSGWTIDDEYEPKMDSVADHLSKNLLNNDDEAADDKNLDVGRAQSNWNCLHLAIETHNFAERPTQPNRLAARSPELRANSIQFKGWV